MLKITLHDGPDAIAFKLEGKLVGPYARELQQCWTTASSIRGSKALTVDLCSIDFIDDEGRRVLGVLRDAGATFQARGPLVRPIVEEITGKPLDDERSAPAPKRDHPLLSRVTKLALCALALASVAWSQPVPTQTPATTPAPVPAQTPATTLPPATATANTPAPLRLTLADAIRVALKQNPAIAIANLRIAEAQQNTIVSRADLLPQAGLEVSELVRRVNIQAQIGIPFPGFPKHVGPFEIFNAGGNFSIPIFDLTAFRRWQASRENVSAARAQGTSAREQNVQLVVSQYLGALRNGADVDAARSRVDVAKALLDLATDVQRSGVGTRIDTLRADVEYRNEQQRLINAQTQFRTSVFGLARLLNIDPRTPIELTDLRSFFQTPAYEGAQTIEEAFANRPELQANEAQLRALEKQHAAASAARLPRLAITGAWSEMGLTPASVIPTYNYQAALDIPLFTGGRIRAQQELASLEVQRVQQERQDLRNRVALEVQTAAAQLEAARTQVDVAREGVKLAQEELTQARDRFQAGVANNIEVIQAQDQAARASDNEIQALYQYNQARADLARATGQIERIYTR